MPTDAKKQSISTWRIHDFTLSGAPVSDSGHMNRSEHKKRDRHEAKYIKRIVFILCHTNNTIKQAITTTLYLKRGKFALRKNYSNSVVSAGSKAVLNRQK